MFNFRKKKIDLPVIWEVIHNDTYSRLITLDKKDNWLDIGGHIGTFSIDIAGKVNSVVAYEPEKENFKFLQMNIIENKIKNIYPVNKAIVGDYDTERTFKVDNAGNTGGNSFIAAEKPSETTVRCDNINKAIKYLKINKIKMDCEGAEDEILRAMDFSNIEEIVFEYHFNLLGMTKYEELLKLLKEHFKIVRGTDKVFVNGQCIVYCKKL
jgi:FkbM family methyltransferase